MPTIKRGKPHNRLLMIRSRNVSVVFHCQLDGRMPVMWQWTKANTIPTEAEWEYAARSGTSTVYSFGDDARQLGQYAWYAEDFITGSTHPVGQKTPNAWGLHDMHGNVWEWVQDWYDSGYYSRSPTDNPTGPSSGLHRVVRGGSWHQTGDGWRSSARRDYPPDYRGISIGFRVAVSLP